MEKYAILLKYVICKGGMEMSEKKPDVFGVLEAVSYFPLIIQGMGIGKMVFQSFLREKCHTAALVRMKKRNKQPLRQRLLLQKGKIQMAERLSNAILKRYL